MPISIPVVFSSLERSFDALVSTERCARIFSKTEKHTVTFLSRTTNRKTLHKLDFLLQLTYD